MGDVVVITFPQTASGESTDFITDQLSTELETRRAHGFIFDCSQTDTYTVDVRAAGARLLSTLAKAGATEGCCVTDKSSIRMIGTAVAFVAGVNVKFIKTVPEALDYLQGRP